MEVNTVTMEPEAAAQAFKEYRAAFMAERNRIDGELMRGYKTLAEGKTLISLTDAIEKGGLDASGRPNLAVARADEPDIQMRIMGDGEVRFRSWRHPRSADHNFNLPAGHLPAPPRLHNETWREAWFGEWQAATPFIPPQYRPPLKLDNYHLLWEAEWRQARGPQRRDPMLLRRVGGDLFAVVAAWDLTEIEKLVLAR